MAPSFLIVYLKHNGIENIKIKARKMYFTFKWFLHSCSILILLQILKTVWIYNIFLSCSFFLFTTWRVCFKQGYLKILTYINILIVDTIALRINFHSNKEVSIAQPLHSFINIRNCSKCHLKHKNTHKSYNALLVT
jgi:hypothetical protein